MDHSQSIFIGKLAESSLMNKLTRLNKSSIIIICDENTQQYVEQLKTVIDTKSVLNVLQIKSGEEHKNIQTVMMIWDFLTQLKCTRETVVLNLGGGVITDMGGFAAATYKRGIDFVNIPTTLLSMVDAAIGGKTGVDYLGYKNQIGVFQHPIYTIIDASFLQTLPKEQLVSGYAEVLKHGLIADKSYWELCSNYNLDSAQWEDIIKKSLSIKETIVLSDPLEKGARKMLNFGHSIGHAIESFFLNVDSPILHGNAVAAGMICEAYISYCKGFLPKQELDSVVTTINHYFEKIRIQPKDYQCIIDNTKQDKKNTEHTVNLTLLNNIGVAIINQHATDTEILDALVFYFEK